MTVSAASKAATAKIPGLPRWGRLAVAAAIALVLAGIGGYAIGRHGTTSVQVLTGRAYVGDRQAGVTVGDWTYGFTDSVPMWTDASGTEHESGWPSCLNKVGSYARIRFGAVPVTDPNGIGMREVVWVDCRG